MATPKRAPRSGANRRSFEPPRQDTIDRTVWVRPEPVAAPISMPALSMGGLSDEDVGLPPDPVAQQRAETYITAVIGYRLREAAKAAKPPIGAPTVVNVEVDDDSLSLSSDDAVILAELRRIKAMPVPRWMANDPGRLAS